jgi:hypothetical protein
LQGKPHYNCGLSHPCCKAPLFCTAYAKDKRQLRVTHTRLEAKFGKMFSTNDSLKKGRCYYLKFYENKCRRCADLTCESAVKKIINIKAQAIFFKRVLKSV